MAQSSWQKQQQPLDTLQSMINGVLIETGKALRSANRKGVKTIGQTHDRLQAFLPNAIDKFHLALDELESDIVRAKAVLGRDLRELQARQKLIENPPAQQVESATYSEDQAGEEHTAPLQLTEVESPEQITEAEKDVKVEEEQVDNPANSNIKSPKPKVEMSSPPLSPTLNIGREVKPHESLEQAMQEATAANTRKADDSKNDPDFINPETAHGLGITTSNTAPSAVSEVLADGVLQETNFDSMFDAGNADSDLNFDFDFGGDTTNTQTQDFGESTADFDLSNFGNQAQNENGDSGSMLHGLDNFGNAGDDGDFAMLDLSTHPTNKQSTNRNTGDEFGMSGGDLDMALAMGANESAFDDLLDGMDFGDGVDNGAGGSMMDHGEFDEAFFGLNSDV